MQFLIFAFILMSLLSSLRKKARRIRSKEPFFDPWSFGEESPEDKMEDTPENTAETADMGVLKPAEKPEIKEAEEQQDVMDDILYAEEDEKFEPLPKQEKVEPFMPSLLLDEEGERETTRSLDSTDSQQVLKELLLGQQLPLAIIASEILGPPKALRPTRNRL
ncbi:MAG: hypothetical protein GX240_02990 [Candidatus Atribacteria bacterium]|jgi:hypothetical protein|nr:hypothetical protein [Candidatus Atribacteria bacterium]